MVEPQVVQNPQPAAAWPTGFELIDLVAALFFLIAWMTHYWVVYSSPLRTRSISYCMFDYRVRWMKSMMHREAHMVDALIQNSLQQGNLFFASSSILVIGAMLAGLGAADQAVTILNDLPFSTQTTRLEWDIKVVLVLLIFTFAFFKFAWSYRLFNYVIILIGSAPQVIAEGRDSDQFALKLARLHALGASHFQTGLNAFFFALAASTWFLNAWIFLVATVWVSLVLYRRAFRSTFRRVLAE